MNEDLCRAMRRAAAAVENWPSETVEIVHHNDADGLTSAAILSRAFSRRGYTVRRLCLEKPYPEVVEKIFRHGGRLLVFADFAGRIAPQLAEMNGGRNLVLILDHHPARPANDPGVHNLDPELFGLRGDREISASTTCYRFACRIGAHNRDLAHLAVVGAVGDGFFVNDRLAGENRRAEREAADQGTIRGTAGPDGTGCRVRMAGTLWPVHRVAEILDTLGAAGYYRGGPELAVESLLEGFSFATLQRFERFSAQQDRLFRSEIEILRRDGLKTSPNFQWFHVGGRFSPLGVKTIGIFCRAIRSMDFVDPDRYIVGFQPLPERIPGFGAVGFDADKVSLRVPAALEKRILKGLAAGADRFMPQATDRLGGFSDACHRLAAATTVGRGRAAALIDGMERVLSGS